ncbi:MAG: zinc ribbon domain-containing protein [Bacteroidales bacterium]|nr:zinc ribbon domain-containing protein [Bacteroidales bacterium]
MAQLKCPECGKEISESIGRCPHCGYPIAEKKSSVSKWLIILGVVVIIVLVGLLFLSIRSMSKGNNTIDQRVLFVNQANAFIETLPSSCKVMETIIDSITQKIYYYDDDENKNPSIYRYDISSKDCSLIMDWDTEIDNHLVLMYSITDYKYVEVNKRLFVISENTERDNSSNANVVFIDVRDDKVYLVANGEQALFTSSSIIEIKKPEVEIEISIYDEIESMKKANATEHPYWYYYGE